MKLEKIIDVKGKIQLLSGLHIGGGDEEMHIGGTDNPVIKNPHTNKPYIPGSSLKGKLRSLLEWRLGLVGISGGKPFGLSHLERAPKREPALALLQLFGVSGGDKLTEEEAEQYSLGFTRLAFRDCEPCAEWLAAVENRNLPLTETKYENCINRISGTAENPRNFERVPAGAEFDFSLSLRLLEGDDEARLTNLLLTGLRLLELDALGGSGSRGYGRVRFVLEGQLQQQLEVLDPFGETA
ncbi:type III-A CRISPR-associated RAMP protein Csm3 [Microbulbifer thermotolerans]|uniref:CRISPR system Cms endoribonuclease Csm3 n=1 Tax=Microbulbifer thermotolerans TaxID=252514 RepID=A0AB35I2G6_MICTH|nr:type III-A CRISPR-associated RAMP protein Csm3 [Microbulbifer thermotolerans]MCX2802565.1 type III-A CRISPR-associated RAMP protein Csm3 [Microbulbifer thermotolerans]